MTNPGTHALVSVRVEEDMKRAARAKAALEGRTISDVITEYLDIYVKEGDSLSQLLDAARKRGDALHLRLNHAHDELMRIEGDEYHFMTLESSVQYAVDQCRRLADAESKAADRVDQLTVECNQLRDERDTLKAAHEAARKGVADAAEQIQPAVDFRELANLIAAERAALAADFDVYPRHSPHDEIGQARRAGEAEDALLAAVRELYAVTEDRDGLGAGYEGLREGYVAAVAERDQAWADLMALRGQRVVSAVFGHHKDAPRPFALYRPAPDRVIAATGAEFPDGRIALRQAGQTKIENYDRMETLVNLHAEDFRTGVQVIWLSDELEPLAEMEAERDQARLEAERLRTELAALQPEGGP